MIFSIIAKNLRFVVTIVFVVLSEIDSEFPFDCTKSAKPGDDTIDMP